MTRRHLLLTPPLCSFVLLLSSCTTASRPQKFAMSFLPPAPKGAVVTHYADTPIVEPSKYLAETPTFIYPNIKVPNRPTAADARITRANEHYEAGRKLYQAGNMDEARKEFDRAIEVLLNAPDDLSDRIKIEKRLEEMVATIHRIDVNSLGAGDLAGQPGYDKAPLEDILELTFPIDPGLKPRVKEQVLATSSALPLEVNDSVLSYIHFFSGERGRHTLLAGLKRSGRYRPMIQRVLAEVGVPQELIYLAQAESGFYPRAVSNKAAAGMWQFVKFRGQEYGLMQTPYSDDRLDPEKATRSAARHLKDLYNEFGDWYLAIAAYNCGPGNVEKAVQRTGYADFWQLRERNVLPRETTNYVPIILAITIMAKNPKAYDLEGLELDPALDYETVKLTSPTHLTLISDLAERPVSDLRDLNPSLMGNLAPGGYELRVPKGAAPTLLAGLETVPENRRTSWRVHRVAQGDTIASIAKRYNMSSSALLAANNNASSPEIGNLVLIPTSLQESRPRTAAPSRRTTGKKVAAGSKGRSNTTARNSGTVRKTAGKGTSKTAQRRGVSLQRASLD